MMSDDQGREETGYNGHPHVKTPTVPLMSGKAIRNFHNVHHPGITEEAFTSWMKTMIKELPITDLCNQCNLWPIS
jgi:hypothetical protein